MPGRISNKGLGAPRLIARLGEKVPRERMVPSEICHPSPHVHAHTHTYPLLLISFIFSCKPLVVGSKVEREC